MAASSESQRPSQAAAREPMPPLVAPGPALSDEQRDRAERQIGLPGFGEQAQRRLSAARVLVIGAGGLGSASVPYLAGAGVGTIGIIDDDVVELSNLHRQVAHTTADIGRAKTTSLAQKVRALDPGITVIEHNERLTSHNALALFTQYDLVLDGSDNFPTRYLANDAAQLTGTPLVWGAILQHHGQVGVAWHAHGPGYRDLFPVPPAPGTVPDCAVGGVLPGLCGTIGSLLATEALKLIAGIGDPLIGRVLVYDALAARTREISYAADPAAEAVTELIDYELFCGIGNDSVSAATSVSAAELAAVISESGAAGRAYTLIDVRTPEERGAERIAGSIGVPLDEIEAAVISGRLPAQLMHLLEGPGAGGDVVAVDHPAQAEVYVHCARDPRSVRAVQLLAQSGLDARYVAGGIHEFARIAPQYLERN